MSANETRVKSGGRVDFASVGGILIAIAGIVGGLIMEGGKVRDIAQITAALIVLGGTFGAVMLNTPAPVLFRSLRRLRGVFASTSPGTRETLSVIFNYAAKARRTGLVSLEKDALSEPDPFLRKSLNLAIDGADLKDIRAMMELEIDIEEQRAEQEAHVFESAGGYSPTIGIIGAVLGLIQVMKNLANIDQVGHGIAVAFVATIYGVALANVFLLPVANKIKTRARQETEAKQMMLEGVAGIVEGLNPKLIRSKLEAYLEPAQAARESSGPVAASKRAAAAGA
ncbi:MAG TPA: flagellar motor protein [Bryobacteraceae bacterium]|nr:flagellar motor protein [Bryobacteraceae bacterium]